jgi:hypothetical protein
MQFLLFIIYVCCVFYKSLDVKLYSSSTSVKSHRRYERANKVNWNGDQEEWMISGRQTKHLIWAIPDQLCYLGFVCSMEPHFVTCWYLYKTNHRIFSNCQFSLLKCISYFQNSSEFWLVHWLVIARVMVHARNPERLKLSLLDLLYIFIHIW